MQISRNFSQQATGQNRTAIPDNQLALVGMILIVAYAGMAVAGWHWPWLVSLQEIELYKQLTGLAMVLLFAAQWRLMLVRAQGAPRRPGRMLLSHRNWGVLAPVLLYLHASGFGHAYVQFMCLAFLALLALGFMHRPINRLNQSWVMTTWLVTHIALAAMLMLLVGYHAFNSFYYE
jgi:hypothetical protein